MVVVVTRPVRGGGGGGGGGDKGGVPGTKPSPGGSVFDWGWLNPLGIGLGSPMGGGDDVVSTCFYVSWW